MLLNAVAGLHSYVPPPVANSSIVPPMQIVVSAVALITGDGFTVMSTESRARQPLGSIPITTYSVVDEGVATGFGIPLFERPADGDHVKNAPCSTFN